MDYIKHSRIVLFSFVIYFFSLLWVTLLNRLPNYYSAHFDLFWSYKEWLLGNVELGREILRNILLFIPFGYLLSSLLQKKKLLILLLFSVLLSGIIEIFQLFLMRGIFEFDDVFNNTIGTMIGWIFYVGTEKIDKDHNRRYHSIGCVSIIIVCTVVVLSDHGGDTDESSKRVCFQIDSVETNDGWISLTGFVIHVDHPDVFPSISLKSIKNGKIIDLNTKRIKRLDVGDYFSCEFDYCNSGFIAEGKINTEEEYEVYIKERWPVYLSTGVFVSDCDIHYISNEIFKPPTGINELTKEAILHAYKPDYHCWIYQMDNTLYLIADTNFYFSDNGSTYIELQLYTTQREKLPKKRVENGWYWDNIGGCFEEYELHGDYGSYRIMKRELPTEYSIVSVEMGQYIKGNWLWHVFFRPYYYFRDRD